MPVTFYDSLGEFHASLPTGATPSNRQAESWNGNQTYEQARDNLFQGDPKAVERSNKILDQLDADGIELAQSYWDNDRVGFIPCIPSFLAGSPESMRRLQEFQTETAPIKIFASVCLSGGFSAKSLETRGTAILALARKLSAIRAVELWVYADMHGKKIDETGNCAIPVIKIDTSPLDLTTASYAMANAGFLRQLCFAWGDARGFTGGWAWGTPPDDASKNLRKCLAIGEKDLLIHGAYLTDALMNDPLQWVNDQVRKYSTVIQDLD